MEIGLEASSSIGEDSACSASCPSQPWGAHAFKDVPLPPFRPLVALPAVQGLPLGLQSAVCKLDAMSIGGSPCLESLESTNTAGVGHFSCVDYSPKVA